MRAAFAAWCDACRLDPPADFVINAHHGNVGCAGANKDFPHVSFRAAVPEVLDQRFPDGLKQRQKRMITRFGAADVQNVRGAVAELVGIEGGVVSEVINLESSGVEASDWRLRHDQAYHEA